MRVLADSLAPQHRRGRWLALLLLCGVMLSGVTGLAQAQSGANDDGAGPPDRVARLSYVEGDLGFLPAGASDWSDADLNRPLTTGDRLSSSAAGRAELEFGGATVRMDGGTDVGLLDLDDQLAQLELTQGTVNVSVRHLDDGQTYEIDTPTVALVIDQPGSFRLDIDGGATRVAAFEGNATVYGENNARRDVFAGRSYRFVDAGLSAVAISDIGGGDGFDAWVNRRDQRYAQSDSSEYVPDDMVGTPDLREYGAWQSTSDYGPVWYPNDVDPDWAPYRVGHWAYVAPWGWTWIDAMPWGFAPYHYGRWAHTPRGWGWIPGPRDVRPIYAPALVAFVGGGGWSVGIGSGPVGWFPLGPGEIYNPWYRCNRDYYTRVNVTNIRVGHGHNRGTVINRVDEHYGRYRDNRPQRDERYVNRNAPRGFTAVSGREFAAGQRVQRHLLKVDSRQLAAARVMPRGADVRPLPGSRAASRSAHVQRLPLGGFRREVVARHAPPVVGERRIGAANGRPRGSTPVSSVRLLNSRENPPRSMPRETSQPTTAAGTRVVGERPRLPAASPPGASAASVERRNATAGQPRQGGLPSERFAHHSNRDNTERNTSMPRSGVSYISAADRDASRPTPRRGATLPQVPQIQRAGALSRPGAVGDARPSSTPANLPRSSTFERGNPGQPRFQRSEPAARAHVREEARPVPTRSEPPRQIMQQPRYEQPRYVQPQRAAPPPRSEVRQPRRSEPQQGKKAPPNWREEKQRH